MSAHSRRARGGRAGRTPKKVATRTTQAPRARTSKPNAKQAPTKQASAKQATAKQAAAQHAANTSTRPGAGAPALRLGFVRGVSPRKWAERWARASAQPLELVPVAPHELNDAREAVDVLLERVGPAAAPPGTVTAASAEAVADGHQHRHAVRLYEETVALVVSAEHELAAHDEVDLEDLSLVPLLAHPDHVAQWPAAVPWQDPSWAPTTPTATLELVATGLGGALMAQPLARHLSSKRAHKVLTVTRLGQSLLPGTEIWVTWAASRDADDIQHLVGVLRGRTSRSSRTHEQ